MSKKSQSWRGEGILCPQCKSKKQTVIDSRSSINAIRRRRKCLNCDCRFSTYESLEKNNFEIEKKIEAINNFKVALDKIFADYEGK